MIRQCTSLFAIALFSTSVFACLNTYEEEIMVRMLKDDPKEAAETIARLEVEYNKGPSIAVTNDLSVAHVLSGNYQKAVELLRSLEAKHPGYPKTATNLGTALELSGNNEEALTWIKEGIKRDPKDHEGTEWLHVKILEAKLAIAKDPNWLASHSVLGADFGSGPHPAQQSEVTDYFGEVRTVEDAAIAIQYQLHERLRFVSIPDPLIGDLYFSWANIEALPTEHSATDYYDAALKFGAKNEALIKARSAEYAAAHPAPTYDDGPYYGPWIVSLFLFFIVAVASSIFFYRRGRASARIDILKT